MANKPGKGYGWARKALGNAQFADQAPSDAGDNDAVGQAGSSGPTAQADDASESQRAADVAAQRRQVQQAVMRMNRKILGL